MKKTGLIFSGLLIVILAGIYIFIPSRYIANQVVSVTAPESVFFKYLSPQKAFAFWWPGKGKSESKPNSFSSAYDGIQYEFTTGSNNNVMVKSTRNGISSTSAITFLATGSNTSQVFWNSNNKLSLNPIERIKEFRLEKKISDDKKEILQHLKLFLENEKNIYGFKIEHRTLKDSLFISTKFVSENYPEEPIIYKAITKLRSQIPATVTETDYPALQILKLNSGTFQSTVSIPVDKVVKTTGDVFMDTRALGNVIAVQVTGGVNTIQNAASSLESYIKDRRLISQGIPYQALLTDRSAVPDSSKWATLVYFPIF